MVVHPVFLNTTLTCQETLNQVISVRRRQRAIGTQSVDGFEQGATVIQCLRPHQSVNAVNSGT